MRKNKLENKLYNIYSYVDSRLYTKLCDVNAIIVNDCDYILNIDDLGERK